MSDRERSSPTLIETGLKNLIGGRDGNYPLISGINVCDVDDDDDDVDDDDDDDDDYDYNVENNDEEDNVGKENVRMISTCDWCLG
ncbi:hypothetical protein DOY81_003146 [Sarcophaga bullata]|nr:hypothetical protein DOY81_003146 [Sarcophaga bullata]